MARGFFKRVMSLGSKKNKKQRPSPAPPVPSMKVDQLGVGVRTSAQEDVDAVVNQLLRSSSARYATPVETAFNDLPPIPHPINKVIQTPAASSASLASSTVSQRGTYTVKVHPRQRHSSTEFPNAIPDFDDDSETPQQRTMAKDNGNLLRLRSDPSVASLLDLYDSHGALSDDAFSNSPEKIGRAQVRRSGSTLRQLMGEASRHHDASGSIEGDISWAERFLRETDCVSSSASSVSLPTPEAATTARFAEHQIGIRNQDDTVSSIHDMSQEARTISSMDVEVSETSNISFDTAEKIQVPHNMPKTPRRASQVFNFLTQKRSSSPNPSSERPLPDLPSYFSSPSDEGHVKAKPRGRSRSHFSDDSSDHSTSNNSRTVIPSVSSHNTRPSSKDSDTCHSHSKIPTVNISQPMSLRSRSGSRSQSRSGSQSRSRSPSGSTSSGRGRGREAERVGKYLPPNTPDPVLGVEDPDGPRPVKLIHRGQMKVVVTAPTPSHHNNGSVTPSRIPRGPRTLKNQPRDVERRPTLLDRSNSQNSNSDPFTVHSQPQKEKPVSRSRSGSSSSLLDFNSRPSLDERPSRRSRKNPEDAVGKENNLGLAVQPDIPFTPYRSNSRLQRSAIDVTVFQPPSPASSSELSPVGKQIMMDLRMQKKMSRKDRERSKKSENRF